MTPDEEVLYVVHNAIAEAMAGREGVQAHYTREDERIAAAVVGRLTYAYDLNGEPW